MWLRADAFQTFQDARESPATIMANAWRTQSLRREYSRRPTPRVSAIRRTAHTAPNSREFLISRSSPEPVGTTSLDKIAQGLQLRELQTGDPSPGAVAHPPVVPKGLAEQSVHIGRLATTINVNLEVHGRSPYMASYYNNIQHIIIIVKNVLNMYVATFERQNHL